MKHFHTPNNSSLTLCTNTAPKRFGVIQMFGLREMREKEQYTPPTGEVVGIKQLSFFK